MSTFSDLKRQVRERYKVTMGLAKHIKRAAPYASRDDFCRIFHEKMDSLYLLAFLLTADHRRAEQCFVSGLEDALGGNPVFREWAHSWARRMIIQNAVRLIKSRSADGEWPFEICFGGQRLQDNTSGASGGDFRNSGVGALRARCVCSDRSRASF